MPRTSEKSTPKDRSVRKSHAQSPEAYESYLINLAQKEAERRIKAGTATSQLLCHYLDLGSERKKLEMERIRSDLRVAEAKIKQMERATATDDLYNQAIKAFKKYNGQTDESEDDEDYYDD